MLTQLAATQETERAPSHHPGYSAAPLASALASEPAPEPLLNPLACSRAVFSLPAPLLKCRRAQAVTLHARAADRRSLFLFDVEHPVRKLAIRIVASPLMEAVAMLFVFLSCAILAIENPHAVERHVAFVIIERVGLGFFCFEAAVTIVEQTLVVYVQAWGHILDLVVIANQLVSMFAVSQLRIGVRALKILRAFRVIRLVRVISHSPSMVNVVQSISLSLKEMSNVVLIMLLILTIFGILGVQLFAGKLFFCNDDSVPDRQSCVGALRFRSLCLCGCVALSLSPHTLLRAPAPLVGVL